MSSYRTSLLGRKGTFHVDLADAMAASSSPISERVWMSGPRPRTYITPAAVSDTSTAMMAITTSNSIKVKAARPAALEDVGLIGVVLIPDGRGAAGPGRAGNAPSRPRPAAL